MARWEQADGMDLQTVLSGHRLPYIAHDEREIVGCPAASVLPCRSQRSLRMRELEGACHFLHDDEALFASDVHGKCCAPAALEGRMALRYRGLNVLWIMVATTDNNDILEASGDKELSLPQKAQVTSAEEGVLSIPCEACLKGLGGGFGTPPIALRNTWASNPDFAYLAWETWGMALGIDNDNTLVDGQNLSNLINKLRTD